MKKTWKNRPRKPSNLDTEHDIQDEIKEAINASGMASVWRQNSGKAQIRGYWVQMSRTGSGDLTGITRTGRRLEIEVKQKGEKQTPEQIIFQHEIEKWGGVYILAHSASEAISLLQKSFPILPA